LISFTEYECKQVTGRNPHKKNLSLLLGQNFGQLLQLAQNISDKTSLLPVLLYMSKHRQCKLKPMTEKVYLSWPSAKNAEILIKLKYT